MTRWRLGTSRWEPLSLRLQASWPLPALLSWGLSWCLWLLLPTWGVPPLWALALSAALSGLCALAYRAVWRSLIVAAGWPLSLLLAHPSLVVPGWLWLMLLALLMTAYPLRSWRDAPWYPTPLGALAGVAAFTGTTSADGGPIRVLDAGCGSGAGLRALRREFPEARLAGVEWSLPLWLLCRWRCRDADVRRGDMWAGSWADHDVVYLFQRPESMRPALDKAMREMQPGNWLVSLAFSHPTVAPVAHWPTVNGRSVWLYRIPAKPRRASPLHALSR